MRDGVKLFTAVYVPKTAPTDKDVTKDGVKGYPIMLTRTPYSVAPYGIDSYRAGLGPSEQFSKDGFIFAYQDVRGRYMSEGEWLEMTPHRAVKNGPKDVDESTDTYDTIDWLIKNIPNNNGRAGLYGTSYPGFYAAAGIIDAHPALKAASPQAPIADLFMGDDSYHNGAFMLAANFGFYTGFYPREGGPSPAERPRPVRLRHARRLRLLPAPGAAGERGREAFQGQESVLDREHPEHHLQRLLEVALDSRRT